MATIPVLSLDNNPVPMKVLGQQYRLVKELNVPQLEEGPEILIGLENADLIATRQVLRTTKNGPLLQRTELDWTMTGRVVVTTEKERQPVQLISIEGPGQGCIIQVERSRRNTGDNVSNRAHIQGSKK